MAELRDRISTAYIQSLQKRLERDIHEAPVHVKKSLSMRTGAVTGGAMQMYILFATIRVLWSLLPQQGYIHPDEFFQSVEVVAGDAFNITVERTWEFDPKSPLRSMVINNILFTPVYTLLHYCSSTLGIFTLTGRYVLSASRLVMVCLSFILDYNVWKIAKLWNLDAYTGVTLLSYSYVILTYQTHSFSNSVESVLLIMVIAVIVNCGKHDSVSVNRNRERKIKKKVGNYDKKEAGMPPLELNYMKVIKEKKSTVRSRKTAEGFEKDQLKKSKQLLGLKRKQSEAKSTERLREDILPNVTFTSCVILASINAVGIFNRPTFALFTLVPFLYWCYIMRSDLRLLFKRISQFAVLSLLCTAVFCGFDTLYYRKCSLAEILSRGNYMEELVFTPWNFVKYNSVSSNLDLHGRHPFYLHFLVNLPLLFGPMTLLLYCGCLSLVKDIFSNLRLSVYIFRRSNTKKDGLDSSATSLDFNYLSLLMFIIIPVILLSIFPHQEPRFLIPLLPIVILFVLHTSSVYGKSFVYFNLLFNVVLSILYGVLHQGGVIPCLYKLQELSALTEMSQRNTTVLFSNTYMPPRHILLQIETSRVTSLDLKGSNSEIIAETILKIQQKWDDNNTQKNNELFVVMPGTVLNSFKIELKSKVDFTIIEQFYFHLTLEDSPRFTDDGHLMDQLSLFLLKVS